MASIMVTTYTGTLIDEAEKQAKVRQSHSKKFALKPTYFAGIVAFDEESQRGTSLVRNLAVP